MKKGKLFEIVIHVIQEALKNSSSTIVRANHELIDNAALKREFDIIIESVINNFLITIAIECKDYKSKVSVEKIEAFESKCNAIPQINKKIFVSRVGFQSGAIAKAKLYGIELLLLEKITEEEVFNWLQIGIPSPIFIERVLARPAVKFIGEPFDFSPDDLIVIEDKGINTTLLSFMKDVAIQNLTQSKIFVRTSDTPMPRVETMTLRVDFPMAYLVREEKKCQISNLWFDIEHIYTNLKSEVSFDKYRDIENEQGLTESVTVVSENQDVYSFVKKSGKKEIEIISKVVIDSEERIMKVGEIKVEKINTTPNKA